MIIERAHVVGFWALLIGAASVMWPSVGAAEEQRSSKSSSDRGITVADEVSAEGLSARLAPVVPRLGWAPPLVLPTASRLLLTSAPQDEQPGTLERVFWTGPTAGRPSAAKRATLIGAYALSAISAGLTGYWAYSWLDHRAQEQQSSQAGACYNLANNRCMSAIQDQRDRRSYERLTAGGAAATAAFLVSGLLIARYWENTTLSVDAGYGALGARFDARF
jgi:hypothetical protein